MFYALSTEFIIQLPFLYPIFANVFIFFIHIHKAEMEYSMSMYVHQYIGPKIYWFRATGVLRPVYKLRVNWRRKWQPCLIDTRISQSTDRDRLSIFTNNIYGVVLF